MKPGTCFKEDREKVSLDYHRKHLVRLAKSYLLVCQRIGVLPLHCEHLSHMNATQNRPINYGCSMWGYKHQWRKCPLPPQIGMSYWEACTPHFGWFFGVWWGGWGGSFEETLEIQPKWEEQAFPSYYLIIPVLSLDIWYFKAILPELETLWSSALNLHGRPALKIPR